MVRDSLLAIDQGTTSTRAVVYDRRLQPVGQAQVEVPLSYPRPGWVEHDPAALVGSVGPIIYHYSLYNTPVNAALVAANNSRYHVVPDLFTEEGFTAAQVLVRALESTNGDPGADKCDVGDIGSSIRDAQHLDGSRGVLSATDDRKNVAAIEFCIWQNRNRTCHCASRDLPQEDTTGPGCVCEFSESFSLYLLVSYVNVNSLHWNIQQFGIVYFDLPIARNHSRFARP